MIDKVKRLIGAVRKLYARFRFLSKIQKRLVIAAAAALALLVAYVISLPSREYKEFYAYYYQHYYALYLKTDSEAAARVNADIYADYWASYFTSAEYKKYASYALPQANEKTLSYPASSPVAGAYTNARGLALIKEFEGLRREAYFDVGGKLTIGYGHLIKPGEVYGKISDGEAESLLAKDLRLAEAIVKRHVKIPLNENQFAALVSLVYNIGEGHFVKSTLLKKLNKGDITAVREEFARWKHVAGNEVNGLIRRRQAEIALFYR